MKENRVECTHCGGKLIRIPPQFYNVSKDRAVDPRDTLARMKEDLEEAKKESRKDYTP